ncbi:5-formyltetrahydrofolate cyclo-ligase [Spongisporangium articulatum]|uniref:5-formyltetrahydrofolate cyclo-ligase n=1 Tax=Spongisporangium articulatum TaxID=3362603 RepID=A0ABW8AKG0_9ACTN
MTPSTSGHTPAYVQVRDALRALALAQPLNSPDPLPPEGELMRRFGVSRGTVRRATEDVVREGLLSSEPGRGTFVVKQAQVRLLMRDVLTRIGLPDSRFHLDFSAFVPDFTGSARCHALLTARPEYAAARLLFVAPDNSLQRFTLACLGAGKRVLVPTYGMRRGLVLLDPATIAPEHHEFASTLDGMERYGTVLDLEALSALERVDLMVTGGIAFTTSGVHVGTGRAYLDLEWGILAELGLVTDSTSIVGVVHADQVLEAEVVPDRLDVVADLIVTPEGVRPTPGQNRRPAGIAWDALDMARLADIAYLAELRTRAPAEIVLPLRGKRA